MREETCRARNGSATTLVTSEGEWGREELRLSGEVKRKVEWRRPFAK